MKIKVQLKNHGRIDGVMKQGGDFVVIDEKQFTETWMKKIEDLPEPKSKSILKKLFGKA